jgi:hypothetical protein
MHRFGAPGELSFAQKKTHKNESTKTKQEELIDENK